MPLALHCGKAMPIQMHTAPHRNGVSARDPGGFLWVLGKRLLTYATQGCGHTAVDGQLGL
jgi:hypothetical protein